MGVSTDSADLRLHESTRTKKKITCLFFVVVGLGLDLKRAEEEEEK